LFLFFVIFSTTQGQANNLSIAIVLSESTGAYHEFGVELENSLSFEHSVQVIGMDEELPATDMIVAVGMKAAESLVKSHKPVLNVLIPQAGFEKLNRATSATYSAIFIDQPMRRQLALIATVFPEANSIGVLYATPPAELDTLRRLSSTMRFDLQERMVDELHPLAESLSDLLRVSDVLLVLPDTEVYRSDTIRNILLETYRAKVPMVGLSPSYVRAGALCAVYSTPQQMAAEAAEAVDGFATTGKLPIPQHTKEFEVLVNLQVARSLRIFVKDAVQLRGEVRGRQ